MSKVVKTTQIAQRGDFNTCLDCGEGTNGYRKCFQCNKNPLDTFQKDLAKQKGHHCGYHMTSYHTCLLCEQKRKMNENEKIREAQPLCDCGSGYKVHYGKGVCGRCI
jgi:hypothetical protein